MNRSEKEIFINNSWEHFKTDSDNVEMPNLSIMNDNQINGMVSYFKFCYQEEESKLELKNMRDEIVSKFKTD